VFFYYSVAADVTAGRYKPPMTDGVLIPDDAVDAMAEISKTKRRERELLEAARVLRASLTPQKRPAPTKATEPEADKKAKASDNDAVGRNRSAFEKLRAANAAVADPLGDALRASDAVAKPREPDDVWKALVDGAEEEKDVSFWDHDDEEDEDESPAAKAARAKQAAKKMVIRPHERGATARTVEWDETQTQTRTLKNTQSNVSTPVTAESTDRSENHSSGHRRSQGVHAVDQGAGDGARAARGAPRGWKLGADHGGGAGRVRGGSHGGEPQG